MKQLIAGLAVLVLLTVASPSPASIILDQSNYANEYNLDVGFTASTAWRAQTFTVGISGQLARIDVDIYLRQSASGFIQLDLLSTSAGVPTSTVLGNASVLNSSVPNSPDNHAFVTFDLTASNINVTQGEVLAIALSSSNDQLIGGWLGSTTTQYAGGEHFYNYPTNQNGWVAYGEDADLYFKTYVNIPEPATSITITSNDVYVLATDGYDLSASDRFTGTSFPTSHLLDATAGTYHSRAQIDYTQNSVGATLNSTITMEREGTRLSHVQASTTMHFTVDADTTYDLFGSFDATDVSTSGHVYLRVLLVDDTTSTILLDSQHESYNTVDASFEAGVLGGDTTQLVIGSTAGSILAGHDYRWYWYMFSNASPDADGGSFIIAQQNLVLGSPVCAGDGTLIEGFGESNDFNATCGSDDLYWAAHGTSLFYQLVDPVVQFELTATAPAGFAGNSLSIDIEASKENNNANLNLLAFLFNYATGSYESLPSIMPLTTTDVTQTFDLPGGADPNDFVEPGTNEVRLLMLTIQTSGLPNVRTQLDEVLFNFD